MYGLFDQPETSAAGVPAAAPAAAPAASKVKPAAKVAQAFAAANKELLPETFDGLKRMPEAVRPAVEAVANAIFKTEALRMLTEHAADEKAELDPSRSVNSTIHSAKLAALSAVGYLSGAPWHLADATLVKRIADDLAGAGSLDSAVQRLRSVKSINLFVAAVETDDRETYLKAVKGLVRRHKVNGLVVDAELVEWSPEAEFLAACEEIGLRPVHVGIAERGRAARHSMLRPELTTMHIPALFVDSKGRQLELSAEGGVLMQPPAAPAAAEPPRASIAARSPGRAATPAAVAAPAPAPAPPPLTGVAPPSAVQDRIARLREQQSRRGARP